jgi:hypothetical protein
VRRPVHEVQVVSPIEIRIRDRHTEEVEREQIELHLVGIGRPAVQGQEVVQSRVLVENRQPIESEAVLPKDGQGAAVEGINSGYGPDFWAIGIEPDGIFVGVIYSFLSSANGYYETPEEIVVVHYQTVAATLVGDLDGENTTLFGLEVGDPPVENLVVVDIPGPTQSADTEVLDGIVTLVPGLQLVRGDANGNGSIQPLADAIATLTYLFVSGTSVTCLDALDCNDDASVNLADPILLLSWGFAMGLPLPAPFPDCGVDPTVDLLSCDASGCP